ncbi:hypothetical protein [Pedobacter antarcticus]|uniref:hypothetical protein n=1 Tax=Pedobacter antarcticus TaxID=34086 RepID=UPI00292DF3B2|nr:hypothetical protein [Pedobacter antarcticus]
MNLQIYRNGNAHIQVPIDENTFFSHVVMGEHIISSSFIVQEPIDVEEGDYVIFRGEQFTINRPLPPLDKESNFSYRYELPFEGYIYDLLDMPYMHMGALEFSYFGTARAYIQIMVDCMNSISSGWSVGQIDDTEEFALDFFEDGKGFSCKGALIKIAENRKKEFWLTGKAINLTEKAGVETNLTFEYGRGMGLYKVTRGRNDDTAYFNRLYIQGGTDNIPKSYRGGSKRLQIGDVGYLELPLNGRKRRASSIVLKDIFPTRTGTLTAVSADWLKVTDSSIDFDLNRVRIEGVKAYVKVTSGANSGKSFEILKYNKDQKTITIDKLTDSDGYESPNSTFSINAGDKYVLLGISLPSSYVNKAEADLRAEGQILLNKAQNLIPPYSVVVDEKFMRDNGIIVNAGDRVNLKDVGMRVDSRIRVTSVKFPLVNPDQVDFVLSDAIPLNDTEKQILEGDKTKQTVITNDKINAERARVNALNMKKLSGRIFDPDGNLAKGAETLFAGMATIGFDSQNFGLVDVFIDPNPGADTTKFLVSGGKLTHRTYEVEGIGYTWDITGNTWSGLDPAKYYYVYAKCSKYALTGSWEISETQVLVNDNLGFYSFNLGQLYEVNAQGFRGFDFTKGVTYIVGDTITSGILQSIDKQNYWNLNNGKQNVGGADDGWDYDVTIPATLSIRNALAAKIIQVGSGGIVNAGISGLNDNGTSSVRFWSGSDVANKESATFRALDDGTVYMRKARISGDVIIGTEDGIVSEGYTAGWTLSKGAVLSDGYSYPAMENGNNFAIVRASSRYSGDKYNEFAFGTELVPASTGGNVSQVGRINAARPKSGPNTTNIALELKASGANDNIALSIPEGDIMVAGKKTFTGTRVSLDGTQWKFINGLYTP